MLFNAIVVQAQIQRDYVRPVLSSPTVAELARCGNVPVNLASGTVSITVPIYNIQCGILSVPIALSYKGGGIRVNQIASNVGLGWSLNAGGIINVDIIGHSDITSDKRIIKNVNDIINNNYPEKADLNLIVSSIVNADTISSRKNYVDSQPDIFSFNFQGYAGNFVLDENFNAHLLNDVRNLNVRLDKANNTFTIVDNRGIIYDFKVYEKTKTKNISHYFDLSTSSDPTKYTSPGLLKSGPNDPQYTKQNVTAYFLNKITAPDGKHYILFNYESEITKQSTPLSANLYFASGWYPDGSASYSEITNETKRLTTVVTSDGYYLKFDYNLAREDVDGTSKTLTNIALYNASNIKQKSWVLNHSYFLATYKLDAIPQLNKRLKLNSIFAVEDNAYHRFSYYEDKSSIPHRNVHGGQDRFGYFNGSEKGAVKYLFPNINSLTVKLPEEYKPGVPLVYINPTTDPIKEVEIIFNNGSNQNVNPDYINAYSLKEIHYPTGGYSSFIYEPNTYSYYNTNIRPSDDAYWGGIRIKSILNYSATGELASYKYYKYNCSMRPNRSSGTVSAEPRYWTIKRYNDTNGGRDKMLLSTVPFNSLLAVNGDNIIYKNVKEYDGNGSIAHTFNSFYDFPTKFNSLQAYLFYTDNTNVSYSNKVNRSSLDFNKEYDSEHYMRGLERYTEYFDILGKKVKVVSKEYTRELVKKVFGMGCIRNPLASNNTLNDYDLCIYHHPIGKALLTSESESIFQGDNNIQTTKEYTYNSWNLVSKTESVNSNSVKTIIQTRYPGDINTGIYSEMVSKWMLNYPIEEIITQNSAVKSVLNTYKKENSIITLDKIMSLDKTESVSLYNGILYDATYRDEIIFSKYDMYGNINEVKTKDDIPSSFIWSYKGKYPVAEITNMSFTDVKNNLGESFINALLEKQSPATEDIAKIKGLNALLNVHVSIYEYKPLAGISKVTDKSGISSTYEYDSAFRLKTEKDDNLKLLSFYGYNYMNLIFSPSPSTPMSLNLGLQSKYDVLSETVFHVSVGGYSSGNYTYNWVLKNTLGKILESSNKREFDAKIAEAGTLIVSCSVKDVDLNVTKEISKSFQATYLPFDAELFTDVTYYEDNNATFSTALKGGSGICSYAWTLKDASGNLIGSSSQEIYYITLPKGKIGNMILNCKITDTKTGESKTLAKTISVVYKPVMLQINCDDFIGLNIPETYSVTVEGGSGSFSYSWSLKTITGKTLYTGTSGSFNHTTTVADGYLYATCIVKDIVTSEIREVYKNATIANMIKLKNITNSSSSDGLTRVINAEIWSSVKVATIYTSSYASVYRDVRPKVTYTASYGGTYSSLPAGKSTIAVTIVGTKGSVADIGVQISKLSTESVKVDGNLKVGGINTF
jgi:hypothetical protein